MYSDLARWWPLISPPEEYAEESTVLQGLLGSGQLPVQTLLELGSGGGHVASHLTGLHLTLVDRSPQMLEVSRLLNPVAEHLVGDMRTIRLDRQFDAVLVHDAVDYLLTEDELRCLAQTIRAHLNVGGVAVIAPDHTTETFAPGTGWGGSDAPDGRGARYLEWSWDPDPDDGWTQTEFAFLLREPDGVVTHAAESHRFGLFPRQTWLDVLADAGLLPVAVGEQTTEDRPPRTFFVAGLPN